MSPKIITPLLLITITLVITSTPHYQANAITCSDMYNALYPCLGYFQGSGSAPTSECCNGVKKVLSMARTGADRRAACGCLKNAAAGVSGTNIALAAALPAKCGVSIPYKISPSTDCAKVH